MEALMDSRSDTCNMCVSYADWQCWPLNIYNKVTSLMSWLCMAVKLWPPVHLESCTVSSVLCTWMCRWCSSHQSTNLSTSSLQLVMMELLVNLRIAVSSENLTTNCLGCIQRKQQAELIRPFQSLFTILESELNVTFCGLFDLKGKKEYTT